jgi:CRISPR system Cascade subunit CasE
MDFRVSRGFNALYLTHQLVADMFGDRADRGYLFRVVGGTGTTARVLVLSMSPPLAAVPPRPWGTVSRVETRPYDVPFRTGQVVDFEVRLNATRVVTDGSGQKKRVDVWDAEFATRPSTDKSPSDLYTAYMSRQMVGAAELLAARIVGRGQRVASRPGKGSIRFMATDCIGSLRIETPSEFISVLSRGVGRARAFGCGLLCLSRSGAVLPRRYPDTLVEAAGPGGR